MQKEILKQARILIVDDQEPITRLLQHILRQAGYTSIERTTDPRQVVSLYTQFDPDLILLDLNMPFMDGYRVMEALRRCIPEDAYLPILVLTADLTPETRLKALAAGARDFLNKPLDIPEVRLRIENLLQTRFLYRQVQRQNESLEAQVRERTQELEASYRDALERLARAAEYRDDQTGEHTQRVGRLSGLVAEALGLPAAQVALIRHAALLHDVGKIGIPDRILLKPGPLSAEEFQLMKMHAIFGARLLEKSAAPLLQLAEEIAFAHHERWDGTGYWGLKEEAIPLAARIVTVIDVFDALTHERPYKHAWPIEDAVAELQRQSGTQFDPRVVEAFLSVLEREPSALSSAAEPEPVYSQMASNTAPLEDAP